MLSVRVILLLFVLKMTGEATPKLDYYFGSYSNPGIHEEMLSDHVRTSSYRDAIMNCRHLFKDKVVLDVGCGTGILSMFAAKAGARMVIGVDMADIIHKARQIVKDNGLDHIVTLIQGKMEEITLPIDQVDIIVSEWMGYFLLYESMLDTVLYARDRYLKPGGLIFPDKATMYLAGIEDGQYKEQKLGFWDNVYGFNMSCMKPDVMKEPLVDTVEAKAIVTKPFVFKTLDLYKVTKQDLDFKAPFELIAARDDYVHAFISWFDCTFTSCLKPIVLPTGPHQEYTHWKQTVFYFESVMAVKEGEKIEGELSCRPNDKNHRELDITISFKFEGQECALSESNDYLMC